LIVTNIAMHLLRHLMKNANLNAVAADKVLGVFILHYAFDLPKYEGQCMTYSYMNRHAQIWFEK